MITIFVTKPLSGNPADGIDNVNISIFKRIDPGQLLFLVEAPSGFIEEESIKKMQLKQKNVLARYIEKILLLRRIKPNYLFGIGAISEVPFILFKPQKTKYVIDWHTMLIKGEGYWRVKTPWFVRWFIFNKADLIIAVSEFAAASVRKYFPHKNIVAIINGVDSGFFNPQKRNEKYLKEKYQIDFSRPLVVFIGALQPRKRPDLFIELAKNYPKANFVAVGRLISRHYKSLGLVMSQKLNNFQWIEKTSREDIAILLASSKIFVFPSLNEASAAVILEAMASGCVPVVSKSGGNPEFLTDGKSGFLIEPNQNEKEEFLRKINLLIKDNNLYQKISQASRLEAEKHSWDKAAELYKEVLLIDLD